MTKELTANRSQEFLKELVSSKLAKRVRKSPTWRHLLEREFSAHMRHFLDESLGPIAVFPVEAKHNSDSVVQLAQYYFPLQHTEQREEKQIIAEHLFSAVDKQGVPLLARGSHVLLSLGSTVFFVGLLLAKWLRDSIECGNRVQFARHAGSDLGFGEWHTDSFEVARLLGPLASVDWAPEVFLCGAPVSRKSYLGEEKRLNVPIIPERRTCDILLMGCTALDSDGTIFAGIVDDKELLKRHLDETLSTVFILATADKLGRPDNSVKRLDFNRRSLDFIVVTNEQPQGLTSCPPGIKMVTWPGGHLS
jgi:hypothetical protein